MSGHAQVQILSALAALWPMQLEGAMHASRPLKDAATTYYNTTTAKEQVRTGSLTF